VSHLQNKKSTGRVAILPKLLHIFGSLTCGLLVALGMVLALPATETKADGPDEGYIVVQFDENHTIVRPISFTAPVSGLAALEMTGLEVVTSSTGFGPAVCAIEGVGDSAANCFDTGFWAYSFWNGSEWEAYAVGAGSSVVNNGAIELWAWSPGFVSPASPGIGPQFVSAAKATSWLAGQQSTGDGGYGGKSSTAEALLAVGANGYTAAEWRRAGSPSLLGYMLANGTDYANSGPAEAGKMAVGLPACNGCWMVGAMQPMDHYSATTGIFGSEFGSGPQAWSILGTQALSQTAPALAITTLKNAQQGNGGWEWFPGWGTDTNSTALAVQSLLAAGESPGSTPIVDGLSYLDAAQNNDGGFPYDPNSTWGTDSDTNSTAYVVQAILAAGQDPMTGTWVISSTNPISYLLDMQLGDGSFEWQSGSGANQLATQQAIPTLLGQSFPLPGAQQISACESAFLPLILKN